MSVATRARGRTVILTAPRSGPVRFLPPRELCGELEVFHEDEIVASVAGDCLQAPGRCFILRLFVADGAFVEEGAPVMELKTV